MNDPPLKECPKCGKEVRRLIFGGAGVIFKGPGFYVTDKGKNKTAAALKPASDKKPQKSESSQSTPAASSPCSECPKKGASSSCPA